MITSTPTALIAAAPSLLRQGLVATLRAHWPLLHLTLTADTTQVVPLLHDTGFNMLVLDAALPGRALPLLLAQVRIARPSQRLVLLAEQPAGQLARRGPAPVEPLLLSRHVGPEALVAALSVWLDAPESAPEAVLHLDMQSDPFSRRELQVLRLVMDDQCNEEIADHLCLSVRTIESHRRTLLQKAGTRTLVGLAARAVREGWVA